MMPYIPSTKPDAAENSLLRVLGGVLALLSILLALLSIILHQRVLDIILAVIVGMFALRVLILWLGDKPQQQQSNPMLLSTDPVLYPMQSPLYTQGQSAPYASSYSQPQSLFQIAPDPDMQQTAPLPTVAVTPPSSNFPRSIRPQRPPQAAAFPAQPTPPPQEMQPNPPSQPTSLWLPPPYASEPMPSPASLPRPSQEGNWQYDDRINFTQQQRGNDNATS